MAPKKNIEIRHQSTLTSCPKFFDTKFVTEIDFYMTEILDEDKSVFLFIYIRQMFGLIGRKSCSMNPSSYHRHFFTEGLIGQCSAT